MYLAPGSWHDRLTNLYHRLLDTRPDNIEGLPPAPDLLDEHIHRYFKGCGLTVVNSETRLTDALKQLVQLNLEFGLVQNSPDSIEGVLFVDVLTQLLPAHRDAASSIPVSRAINRNVCIEPDSATVLEVLERMTVGCCPCTIIVDRNHGHPQYIVSPRQLYTLLSGEGNLSHFNASTGQPHLEMNSHNRRTQLLH